MLRRITEAEPPDDSERVSFVGGLVEEFAASLPSPASLPRLTPESVRRFVELDGRGWKLFDRGEVEAAEALFREQVGICPANPEPHVGLAFTATHRGDDAQAIRHLRTAVVRGFRDLGRVSRAEAWTRLRVDRRFLYMQDALPVMDEAEAVWSRWSAYRSNRKPPSLESIRIEKAGWDSRIAVAAPALGPQVTNLWRALIDRVVAARLEAYATAHPDARDAREALETLLSLYSHGGLLRWEVLSADEASRLGGTARELLRRFPDSPARDVARLCSGLARNADRDASGTLSAPAAEAIRGETRRLLSSSTDPALLALSAEGLVRTEFESRGVKAASEAFREFETRLAIARPALETVRERLGSLALLAGGLPEVPMRLLDGTTLPPEVFRGRVTVLDFWATWCGPCLEELPRLRRLAAALPQDVAIVGVNLDRAGDISRDDLRAWIAREEVPGRQVFDGESWDSDLVKAFGVKEIPFTVVVGPDGSVLAVNPRDGKLEKTVRAALREER